jgi:hypothetical protein
MDRHPDFDFRDWPTTCGRAAACRRQRVSFVTSVGVLVRDGYRCFVPGCDVRADVVDHIEPAHPGMPDGLFFDPRNLRASCRRHNAARGWQTYAARELGTPSQGVTRTYGKPRIR